MSWSNVKKRVYHSILHPRYLASRELLKFIQSEANLLSGRVLDVGCGVKPYAKFMNRAKQYIGLDVPSSMHGLSFVEVVASAQQLPFCNEVFDNLLCTEVLEHVPNPKYALSEMWRVAKPDAILLLTVPLSEPLHEEPYDYYRFTKYALAHLLTESQWEILKITERGGAWLELGYRLSSLLYATIGATKNPNGSFKTRLFCGPFVVAVCALVQLIAIVFDQIDTTNFSTIGYCVIAKKRSLYSIQDLK